MFTPQNVESVFLRAIRFRIRKVSRLRNLFVNIKIHYYEK